MRFGDRHVVFSSGGDRLGGRLTVFDGALWLRTQHLHLVHHDLGGVAAQSVLAVPFVTAQPAFGIDQLATGQELLADRRQPVECDQRVILNVLLPVSVIVLRVAVGREPELGDCQSFGTDDDFWVASQAADEGWAAKLPPTPMAESKNLLRAPTLDRTSITRLKKGVQRALGVATTSMPKAVRSTSIDS